MDEPFIGRRILRTLGAPHGPCQTPRVPRGSSSTNSPADGVERRCRTPATDATRVTPAGAVRRIMRDTVAIDMTPAKVGASTRVSGARQPSGGLCRAPTATHLQSRVDTEAQQCQQGLALWKSLNQVRVRHSLAERGWAAVEKRPSLLSLTLVWPPGSTVAVALVPQRVFAQTEHSEPCPTLTRAAPAAVNSFTR